MFNHNNSNNLHTPSTRVFHDEVENELTSEDEVETDALQSFAADLKLHLHTNAVFLSSAGTVLAHIRQIFCSHAREKSCCVSVLVCLFVP